MSDLLPFVIIGIVTGSLYGLAGIGLVLTYRTTGVFNLGYGAMAAAAAFLFYTLHTSHHVPWPVAASITVLIFGLVGGPVLERITRGFAEVPEAVMVIGTVGILLTIEGYLYFQYGDVVRYLPDFLPQTGFTFQGVNISWSQVITVGIATGSGFALFWFLRASRLGVAMRAVVDNPTLVGLSGDNPVRVRQMAWVIGSGFAALSGILLAPTLGLSAILLTFLVVQAFGACAIGLFSSLPLTYAGGIAVGLAASLATKYLTTVPFNGIPTAMPFLILLLVLLVVPAGRFPERRLNLRSLVPDVRPLSRRAATALTVVGVGAMIVVPMIVGTHLPVWTAGLVAVPLFASLALLVWMSGQISLCHAAFVAVGAAAMGHLTTGFHVPWAVALLLAGLITVPVGAVVAIPAIRLSGVYLALATFGFGILMQDVFYPTSFMFGSGVRSGSISAPRPKLGFFNGVRDKPFYYLVLALAVACIAVMVVISRGRFGRLLRAMAEAPTMLRTHGLSVSMISLAVFCVSAFFAGTSGALAVTQFGSASGIAYGPTQSLLFLAVLGICGTRLIRSSLLAAGLWAIVPGYLTRLNVDRQTLAFGVAAIVASVVLAKREEIDRFLASVRSRRRAPTGSYPSQPSGLSAGDVVTSRPGNVPSEVRQ
jgi:branched-subunit amino acid ABC-type transport system permease component